MTKKEIELIRHALKVYDYLTDSASHALYACGLTDANSGLYDRVAAFADEAIMAAQDKLVKEIEALMDLNEQEAQE